MITFLNVVSAQIIANDVINAKIVPTYLYLCQIYIKPRVFCFIKQRFPFILIVYEH